MRADRLVAILLLLQRRGRVTVADIADELEISERTARRDLEALGLAGVSVYSTPGRGGGWQLAGDGRTDLSGLTEREAHALFAMAGPSADATPQLKAALRKLVRALPEPMRDSAERAGSSFILDPVAWSGRVSDAPIEEPTLLADIRAALLAGRRLRLTYVGRAGEASEREVDPWGLVAKGERWYLVAGTERGQRTFRVDRCVAVEAADGRSERPADFDLGAAWSAVSEHVGSLRAPVVARVRVDPSRWGAVRWMLGNRLRDLSSVADDDRGWHLAEARAGSTRELAAMLAGFGAWIEVVDSPEVTAELARIGHELTTLYGGVDESATEPADPPRPSQRQPSRQSSRQSVRQSSRS